jgi:hypothetical protein
LAIIFACFGSHIATSCRRFFFIKVDIVLLDVNDGLPQKTVCFSNEGGSNLQGSQPPFYLQGTKELASEVQFARAIASLKRIMLSS